MNNGFADILHRGNQPLMDNSAVSMGLSVASYTSGSHGQSQITFGLDWLGAAMDNSCGNGGRGLRGSTNAPAQDDACRLVLGLGPTPEDHSADHQPAGADKSRAPVTLFGQSVSFTDPGVLSLGLHQGRHAGTIQRMEAPAGNIISFAAVEGPTSARRSSGGYMPSLFFAPQPSFSAAGEEHTDNTNDSTVYGHHSLRLSPEPSASMTEASFGTSSDVITAVSYPEHQAHRRHPKKCRFKGCSKGARGASGLCIAHGGGQRCQKPGCHKGAESRTAYCKAHGGGQRCQQLGCTKSAEGKTDHCIAHGGGRRCGYAGCPKAARGKSGRCISHGGGKRCSVEGCIRSAEGRVGLCISHGGGRRPAVPVSGLPKGRAGQHALLQGARRRQEVRLRGMRQGRRGQHAAVQGTRRREAVHVRGRRRVRQERSRRHGVLRGARRRQTVRGARVQQERARAHGSLCEARRRQAVQGRRVRQERAGEHRVLQGARRRQAVHLRRRLREVRARQERPLLRARHAGGLAAAPWRRRWRGHGHDRAGPLPRHRAVG